MRRPLTVEVMLLGTVVLWALNLTVTRYILTHGFQPLAYATVRYGGATLVFLGLTLAVERSLRVLRSDLPIVAAAALALFLNQLAFVYALNSTSASVIGLILGATPIFAALLGLVLRTEHVTGRFWAGAVVSFAGVGLVALGTGGEVTGDTTGIVLGIATAATWAAYSVAVAPLLRRYSPSRVSTLVLALGWIGIALVGAGQTISQPLDLGWEVWLLLVFATLGPLVAHERALVPIAAPHRPVAGNARRQPAAVRRIRVCAGAPVGADHLAASGWRRADRRRHSARTT